MAYLAWEWPRSSWNALMRKRTSLLNLLPHEIVINLLNISQNVETIHLNGTFPFSQCHHTVSLCTCILIHMLIPHAWVYVNVPV